MNPDDFYAVIVAQLATSTSKNIGQAQAPATNTLPYAVVYPRSEDIDPDRLGNLSEARDATFFEFQVTSVGSDMIQALWMVQKTRDALIGFTPVVSGDAFGKCELALVNAVLRDDKVQPPLFYGVDEYQCFAAD